MKFNHGLLFFALFSFIALSILGGGGCASIAPPMGGPRDSLPPRLVTANPKDSVLHFTGNKIVLTFDEYVDVRDARTEMIVSPVPKIDPIVDGHLRTVTIRLKDTSQPNTTYALEFGKTIRDFNEGNVLKNFTYVFSTGDHIDSGTLAGNVIVANTGKVDSTLIVMLHQKFDDSAVVKSKPRYITRLDTAGHFVFRFVKPGRYALYAMKDEGGTRQYLSKSQLFAFADSPVTISRHSPSAMLYAYEEAAEIKKPSSGTAAKLKPANNDKDKRLLLQTNIANGSFDVLDTLAFQFGTTLKTFDSSRIQLTDENFKVIDARNYHFTHDTSNKRFFLYYGWATDTKYRLILAKDFAEDSSGRKLLKDDTIRFATKKDIDYGEVTLRFFNLDLSRHPVLQLTSGDMVKYSFPFHNSRVFRRVLFPPGDYGLRILYDDNENGVWDPGNFFGKKRQPEKILQIPRKFTVKANWDNDQDITL
jgi:hypothetical protein